MSIGKSKVVAFEDAVADYLQSFEAVYPVADYIAVNVSSPNTPRLRELQKQINSKYYCGRSRNVMRS